MDAEELPGLAALQRLTSIEMSGDYGPRFFDPQLVQLPGLQRLVLAQDRPFYNIAYLCPPRPLRLPANMGLLRSSLLHLDISWQKLASFPLALTQLVALMCLHASMNEFAELPAGITAPSRLIELKLGRLESDDDPLQLVETRSLDVRALGDLSGFPASRELAFEFCKVMRSISMPGAVRHSSLTTICFCNAHPAPECELTVAMTSQALRRLGRGRVVSTILESLGKRLKNVQAPCQKYMRVLRATEARAF